MIAAITLIPASIASLIASAANGGGNEDHGGVSASLLNRFFNRIKDRNPIDVLARLTGSYAPDHLGPVSRTPSSVEHTGVPSNTLADNSRIFIDQNAHGFSIVVTSGEWWREMW